MLRPCVTDISWPIISEEGRRDSGWIVGKQEVSKSTRNPFPLTAEIHRMLMSQSMHPLSRRALKHGCNHWNVRELSDKAVARRTLWRKDDNEVG